MRIVFGIIALVGALLLLAGAVAGYSVYAAQAAARREAASAAEVAALRRQVDEVTAQALSLAVKFEDREKERRAAAAEAERSERCDWPEALALDAAPKAEALKARRRR